MYIFKLCAFIWLDFGHLKIGLKHKQLNVCEKEKLPSFLYLIQIFDLGVFLLNRLCQENVNLWNHGLEMFWISALIRREITIYKSSTRPTELGVPGLRVESGTTNFSTYEFLPFYVTEPSMHQVFLRKRIVTEFYPILVRWIVWWRSG